MVCFFERVDERVSEALCWTNHSCTFLTPPDSHLFMNPSINPLLTLFMNFMLLLNSLGPLREKL